MPVIIESAFWKEANTLIKLVFKTDYANQRATAVNFTWLIFFPLQGLLTEAFFSPQRKTDTHKSSSLDFEDLAEMIFIWRSFVSFCYQKKLLKR